MRKEKLRMPSLRSLIPGVLLLAACVSQGTNKATDDTGPMHEMLPPQANASSAGPAPNGAEAGAAAWPLLLNYEDTAFKIYEPVVETLNDGILTAHSVVTARASGQARATAGSVTMKAVAEVDSAAGMARLVNTEVLRVSFPTAVGNPQAWQEFLQFAVPPKVRTIPLAAVESGRQIAQSRERAGVAATAPAIRILVSERPAVLAFIDGEPRYVALKGTKLMGVLNTRVLLLKDPRGHHYLRVYNGWVRAPSLDGPWEIAPDAPDTKGLEQSVRASGRANLLPGKTGADGRSPDLSAGHLPDIIVATQPTALIVVHGSPRYTSVTGTSLEYAVNTSAHLLRDAATGEVYVRVDGFWFRAAEVNGPWFHAPAESLPAAFSSIPDNSPKRAVKASIGVGHTATDMVVVAADSATTLHLDMAGDPALERIRGTELNYVANSSVPIIQVDINHWYAVQSAVWFFAAEVTGPWSQTNQIPPEIYAIPPDALIYHAIHSRVMASTTDVTYYGYSNAPGGATAEEEQGSDYQYTPPAGMSWGWFY